jgi:hypothetical protein
LDLSPVYYRSPRPVFFERIDIFVGQEVEHEICYPSYGASDSTFAGANGNGSGPDRIISRFHSGFHTMYHHLPSEIFAITKPLAIATPPKHAVVVISNDGKALCASESCRVFEHVKMGWRINRMTTHPNENMRSSVVLLFDREQ